MVGHNIQAQKSVDRPEVRGTKRDIREVVLDTNSGRSLGLVTKPNPVTGCGLVIQSLVEGEQAAACGQVFENDVISHINDQDIRELLVNDIFNIIKASAKGRPRFRLVPGRRFCHTQYVCVFACSLARLQATRSHTS